MVNQVSNYLYVRHKNLTQLGSLDKKILNSESTILSEICNFYFIFKINPLHSRFFSWAALQLLFKVTWDFSCSKSKGRIPVLLI